MTHVQPCVEIYLTRGKAKCFVSSCGVAADNMRTSQASSMIVFASALVLTFCVAFSFLFFSSLRFFVGDFFSCFFLLQVNLGAANRLGWQGKDGEKPFVGTGGLRVDRTPRTNVRLKDKLLKCTPRVCFFLCGRCRLSREAGSILSFLPLSLCLAVVSQGRVECAAAAKKAAARPNKKAKGERPGTRTPAACSQKKSFFLDYH